jgi:ubiquinone/menaquinone biosynthesis C-methylase UbiE
MTRRDEAGDPARARSRAAGPEPGEARTGDPALRRQSTVQAMQALQASLFSAPSRSFLAQLRGAAGAEPCELVLDLGCGTGHSTRLVAETLQPRRTIGLDSSPEALRTARSRTRNPGISFVHHDATATPFPVPHIPEQGPGSERGPDFVYSRFLLGHVPDPEEAIKRWSAELRPGGKLLLDEGSTIRTSHEPIGRYLEMVGAMLEHRGTAVDVPSLLRDLGHLGDTAMRHHLSRRITFHPPANGVAAMFRANMDAWRDDPFIVTHVGDAAVRWLETELERLAAAPVRDGVSWDLEQVVFERR